MTRTNKLQGNKKPDKTSKHKRNKVTPEIVDRVPDMISTTDLDEASKQLAYQLLKGAKAAALNDPGIDDNGLSLPWQMLQQIKECQSMNVSQQARVRTRRQNRDPATAPRTPYLDRVKVVCYSIPLPRGLFLNLLATHTERCRQADHPPPEPTDFVRRQTRHGVVKIKMKSATDRKTDETNTAHANAEVSTEQRQTWLYCESGQPGGSMTLTKHATDPLREILKEASYAATGSHMSFTLNQRSPNPKRPASNQLRSEPGQLCLNGKPSPGLAEP